MEFNMANPISNTPSRCILIACLAVLGMTLACARAAGPVTAPWSVSSENPAEYSSHPTQDSLRPLANSPGNPGLMPTPDPARVLPPLRTEPEQYTVKAGDTLGTIAQEFSTSLDRLVDANDLVNPNLLSVGQVLMIPAPDPGPPGPDFKIIPDSELVYGPASVDFDIRSFVLNQGGYLASYSEEVDGETVSGDSVVYRISYEYSINPRLLLALVEYQSGWITNPNPGKETLDYPVGLVNEWRKGLYRQLAWAANSLNRGYYTWRVNGVGAWVTFDGQIVPISPTINAGTAGVQHLFSQLFDRSQWEKAVTQNGLFTVYETFFGYPFDRSIEPLLPALLTQPTMQLPFEEGVEWAYTGGPHGGWGSGSAWAALDFAPSGDALGCVSSDAWVTAVADGQVVRSGGGAVVQDLHGDGIEQTGWTVLYFHIETRDRVPVGTYLRAGDRIGHPSCEGGVSSGTHVHLARRYNGEWIPADQNIPFVLDGWVSRGAGYEYDGYLQRDGQSVEAWAGRSTINVIQR
jgi:LasA protease